MELELVGQPFRSSPSGASFLASALSDPGVERLLIATAWVRASGLAALVPDLMRLRARGGSAELLVGVDLKGTTRQGLELARAHMTSVDVVHDPQGRTFHPKLYLAVGHDLGYALIGSNNLTAGGLGFNYEGALACTFDPRREPGLLRQLEVYVEQVRQDRAICKRLTRSVFARLLAEGWLADEERDRRHRDEDRTRRAAERAAGDGSPLFGRSAVEKRAGLPPRGVARPARGASRGRRSAVALAPDGWWKQLGATDVQRSPVGALTNAVRLTVPRDREDRVAFFRRAFFGRERWRRVADVNGNPTEVATIVADVEIDGVALGQRRFDVSYAPHRAERGRTTTVLRWGDLGEYVRSRELTGRYLLIERRPAGYRLVVTRRRPA